MSDDGRRRLEPLQLEEPASGAPSALQHGRDSAVAGAMDGRQGLDPSSSAAPPGASPPPQPTARPTAGLLAGVFTLGFLAGAGTLGTVLLLLPPRGPQEPPSMAPAAMPRPSASASSQPLLNLPSWRSLLHAATCEAPCCGGAACPSAGGKRCPSGFTCIPGPCESRLADDERWTLHISAIWLWERDGARFRSGCSSDLHGADVCLRPASTGAWTCVPLAEACAHSDHATTGVPITTRDLTSEGIDIEIRSGDTVVASRSRASYGSPLHRTGLCSGFKLGGFTGLLAEVEKLTFFLEPAP
jgi:hypothetical protein